MPFGTDAGWACDADSTTLEGTVLEGVDLAGSVLADVLADDPRQRPADRPGLATGVP